MVKLVTVPGNWACWTIQASKTPHLCWKALFGVSISPCQLPSQLPGIGEGISKWRCLSQANPILEAWHSTMLAIVNDGVKERRQRCTEMCFQTPFSTRAYWNDIYLPEYQRRNSLSCLNNEKERKRLSIFMLLLFFIIKFCRKSWVWSRRGNTDKIMPDCIMGNVLFTSGHNMVIFSGRCHGKGKLW